MDFNYFSNLRGFASGRVRIKSYDKNEKYTYVSFLYP